VLTARHPSQLYASLLEGLFTFTVGMMFWRKPQKPGVIGGIWIITYAIVRIIDESWRMPDAHIGLSQLGLSRGQEISIFMLLIGMGVLLFALKRPVAKVGGWAKGAN
jgi:phosphatidylglycerol:prolipoprotein diacylglycerol transferase